MYLLFFYSLSRLLYDFVAHDLIIMSYNILYPILNHKGGFMSILKVTKLISQTDNSATRLIHEQIQITNVSSDYIHNLTLLIDDKEHKLVEQLVTRSRGALAFEPEISELPLGNLAPSESAYFDYKYTCDNLSSFTEHISLTYSKGIHSCILPQKIAEFLSDSTTQSL